MHALLLLLAVAARRLSPSGSSYRAARASQGVVALVVGALVALVWYLATDAVPAEFTGVTPYVITLLVLALAVAAAATCPRPTACPTGEGEGD